MKDFDIQKYGKRVLRKKAEEVDGFDNGLASFVDEMKRTMVAEEGVGLAAPQVGASTRVIVLFIDPGESPQIVEMINPRITFCSDEQEEVEEGCLSVPGIRGVVPRSVEVEVKYQTLDGVEHTKRFRNLTARIIQHEIDHLEGVLFVDRLSFAKRAMIRGKLKKLARENS